MSASFTIVGANATDAGRVVGLAPATLTAVHGPLGWMRQLSTRRPTATDGADTPDIQSSGHGAPSDASNSLERAFKHALLLIRDILDRFEQDNGMTPSFVWTIGGSARLPIMGPTLISARVSGPNHIRRADLTKLNRY